MMLFDFQCGKCGHEFEEFVESDRKTLKCAICDGRAKRQLCAPMLGFIKMGMDPGFPSAYAKWGKSQMYRAKNYKGSLNSKDKAPTLQQY